MLLLTLSSPLFQAQKSDSSGVRLLFSSRFAALFRDREQLGMLIPRDGDFGASWGFAYNIIFGHSKLSRGDAPIGYLNGRAFAVLNSPSMVFTKSDDDVAHPAYCTCIAPWTRSQRIYGLQQSVHIFHDPSSSASIVSLRFPHALARLSPSCLGTRGRLAKQTTQGRGPRA